MKKFMKQIVSGAIFTLLASTVAAMSNQLDDVKSRGKLIVGIKNDYRPFGYLDGDAQLKGFEIDLAKHVAEKLVGSADAIELVPVIASNRIELLNAGRIDLILATLAETPERARVIDFTDHYYMMAGLVLLGPKGVKYNSWDEVKGKKLCGIQGNLYNKTLTGKYGAELVLYQGSAEMFKAFQDGRCDVIGFDGPILQQKLSEPEWGEKYEIVLDTFNYVPIAGGVRKDEPEFLTAVNEAIRSAEAADILVNAEKIYAMGQSEHVQKRAEAAKAAGN